MGSVQEQIAVHLAGRGRQGGAVVEKEQAGSSALDNLERAYNFVTSLPFCFLGKKAKKDERETKAKMTGSSRQGRCTC